MEFKLDKIDKKLISYLYHNYREPLTKIAKKCNISRDQVEYRLKKYEQTGLIKKYATIINYNILGYSEFIIVWIKLNASETEKKELKNHLKKNKSIITYLDVIGKYDLVIDFINKDKEEFQKELSKILERFETIIKNYSIFTTTKTKLFPLKEFELKPTEKEFTLETSKNKISLDNIEIKILQTLEKNGKAKLIDIAKEINISAELTLYKLKQLYKKKIILGTRIIFDLEKMNYFFGNLRIKITNLNNKSEKKLIEYCKQQKQVNAITFGIGKYNCIIQIFYKEEKIFRETIKKILNEFKNETNESEIILIENEGEVKTIPF